MNIKKILSIIMLYLTLGFNSGKINCDEIKSFSDFEKLFMNDVCYDHDGRIYIKDFSNLSEDELEEFYDSLGGESDTGFIDKEDFLDCINTIFCQKLSNLVDIKIIFNDKACVTKDGRFIGAMKKDVTIMGEIFIFPSWIGEIVSPYYQCAAFLYIQDKNNDVIIIASYVESFEFTQDSKFVDITFKNGMKTRFDLYERKEVVALRDYSKRNGFFDYVDKQLKGN